MTAHHSPQCDWHWDQYDYECNCGVTMPRTEACAESELRSAQSRMESDALLCVALKAELKGMRSGAKALAGDEA